MLPTMMILPPLGISFAASRLQDHVPNTLMSMSFLILDIGYSSAVKFSTIPAAVTQTYITAQLAWHDEQEQTYIDPTKSLLDLTERLLDGIFRRNVTPQAEGVDLPILRFAMGYWVDCQEQSLDRRRKSSPNQSTRSFAASEASSALRSIRTILSAPLTSVSESDNLSDTTSPLNEGPRHHISQTPTSTSDDTNLRYFSVATGQRICQAHLALHG